MSATTENEGFPYQPGAAPPEAEVASGENLDPVAEPLVEDKEAEAKPKAKRGGSHKKAE